MLILLEVEESDNCPFSVTKSFQTISDPRPASRVTTIDPEGKEGLYEIVGWSTEGPVPAHAVLVDDSGEGAAMLVYGAEEGVRLRQTEAPEVWSLDSAHQWGDAFLLLHKDVRVE